MGAATEAGNEKPESGVVSVHGRPAGRQGRAFHEPEAGAQG